MVFLYWSIFKVSVISINKQLLQSSVSLLSILNDSRRTKFHCLPFYSTVTVGGVGADAADVSIAAQVCGFARVFKLNFGKLSIKCIDCKPRIP